MGFLSDYYYTILDGDTVVSVSRKRTVNTNMFDWSVSKTIYELRIDGEVLDSHQHGTFPKSGSMCAILERSSGKRSIRVNVSCGMFSTIYRLTIDSVKVRLKETSETRLKSLWHRNNLKKIKQNNENQIQDNSWLCKCGASNTTKFCGTCGKSGLERF